MNSTPHATITCFLAAMPLLLVGCATNSADAIANSLQSYRGIKAAYGREIVTEPGKELWWHVVPIDPYPQAQIGSIYHHNSSAALWDACHFEDKHILRDSKKYIDFSYQSKLALEGDIDPGLNLFLKDVARFHTKSGAVLSVELSFAEAEMQHVYQSTLTDYLHNKKCYQGIHGIVADTEYHVIRGIVSGKLTLRLRSDQQFEIDGHFGPYGIYQLKRENAYTLTLSHDDVIPHFAIMARVNLYNNSDFNTTVKLSGLSAEELKTYVQSELARRAEDDKAPPTHDHFHPGSHTELLRIHQTLAENRIKLTEDGFLVWDPSLLDE